MSLRERYKWLFRAIGQATAYLVLGLLGVQMLEREQMVARRPFNVLTMAAALVVWAVVVGVRAVQERAG